VEYLVQELYGLAFSSSVATAIKTVTLPLSLLQLMLRAFDHKSCRVHR